MQPEIENPVLSDIIRFQYSVHVLHIGDNGDYMLNFIHVLIIISLEKFFPH